MGMSPEARRRLDERFGQRVERRRQDHAANWEHAVRVGQGLGLGDPLGIYHTEVFPPLGARRVLWLVAPAVAYVAGVVLLVLWNPDRALPFIGVLPFLVGPYVVVCVLITRRRRFTRWLYAYGGGFAEVDPDGPPRPVRWDEITDAVDAWRHDGGESVSSWAYDGFLLTTAGGRTVPVTAKYENALDPYAPIGGMIAALMPAEVGAAIPRFPTIAGLIVDRAVIPVVERQAGAVRGGAVLTRGGVRVTRDGIAGPKDTTVTPWAAIDRIELRPGRVKVRPVAGKARTYTDHRAGSGYSVLCRVLLALGVTASYEARG
ncbi:hypothetical protein AB0J72_07895 [Dactylosporangium sp. NPDC049742]|uniref:hypothetical protein n=1 Tax=Dactylosporangium sp. NPDC049742 TaxID=3154737 RepID=UPI0034436A90